jgi:hypothetical protein
LLVERKRFENDSEIWCEEVRKWSLDRGDVLMSYVFVEIVLDGILCVKRCPKFVDSVGFIDAYGIIKYFKELGYSDVGVIGRVW